jgi:hypothetical protein
MSQPYPPLSDVRDWYSHRLLAGLARRARALASAGGTPRATLAYAPGVACKCCGFVFLLQRRDFMPAEPVCMGCDDWLRLEQARRTERYPGGLAILWSPRPFAQVAR